MRELPVELISAPLSTVISRLANRAMHASQAFSPNESLDGSGIVYSSLDDKMDLSYFRKLIMEDLWNACNPDKMESILLTLIGMMHVQHGDYNIRNDKNNNRRNDEHHDAYAVSYERALHHARSICEVGGHLVIISVMNQFMRHKRIVVAGCAILGELAYFGDFGKAPVVSVGGIQSILQAMRKYPDDAMIQANGCNALRNLIHANCQKIRERHANILTHDDDGSRIVLQAAQTFPEIPTLVVAVCDILETTCAHSSIRDSWNRLGATIILTALQNQKLQAQSQFDLHNDSDVNCHAELVGISEMINRALRRLVREQSSSKKQSRESSSPMTVTV